MTRQVKTKQVTAKQVIMLGMTVVLTAGLSACSDFRRAIGEGKSAPDEFQVVVRIGLTVLAFAVSGWLVWMLPHLDRLQRLAGAAIAGGAIGNAIDRLRFGRVVDFIDFHIGAWHWPAFNVADAAITIGAGLWAYSILFGQETNET